MHLKPSTFFKFTERLFLLCTTTECLFKGAVDRMRQNATSPILEALSRKQTAEPHTPPWELCKWLSKSKIQAICGFLSVGEWGQDLPPWTSATVLGPAMAAICIHTTGELP